MKRNILLVCCVLLMPFTSKAKAPFGLAWEMSKGDLLGEYQDLGSKKLSKRVIHTGRFFNLYVPNPDAAFDDYVGYVNNDGLYAVVASSIKFEDDYLGKKGINQFYQYVRLLETSGFNKYQSVIKKQDSSKGFYSCNSYIGCISYWWRGKNKAGDTVDVTVGPSYGDSSGKIQVTYLKGSISISGF
ncbi:hypothetical protein Q8W40_24395 [Vibrio penaeicida]|uniref:hypothetical protein n=1 Tax=Vibrio penaeicida TaxID=104609 RepID=UPI002735D852|nr:hypothetical protein [Vibrio penaeicida]MDP2575358.1 hypothetical protein [Vibrio penaeicida]